MLKECGQPAQHPASPRRPARVRARGEEGLPRLGAGRAALAPGDLHLAPAGQGGGDRGRGVPWGGGGFPRCFLGGPPKNIRPFFGFPVLDTWPWGITYGCIWGRNTHVPPILMFTRGTRGFHPQPHGRRFGAETRCELLKTVAPVFCWFSSFVFWCRRQYPGQPSLVVSIGGLGWFLWSVNGNPRSSKSGHSRSHHLSNLPPKQGGSTNLRALQARPTSRVRKDTLSPLYMFVFSLSSAGCLRRVQ